MNRVQSNQPYEAVTYSENITVKSGLLSSKQIRILTLQNMRGEKFEIQISATITEKAFNEFRNQFTKLIANYDGNFDTTQIRLALDRTFLNMTNELTDRLVAPNAQVGQEEVEKRRAQWMNLKNSLEIKKITSPFFSKMLQKTGFKESAQPIAPAEKRVKKNIDKLKKLNEREIAALKKQELEKNYLSGEDKEKLERLELLRQELNTNPTFIAEKMQEYSNHPVYLHMQPVKFLSILVKSNQNLALAPQTPPGIPEVERIALYGYTTKDYVYLNEAARKSEGLIKDPGTRAYFEHVMLAFDKLPKVTLPILNKQGLPVDLKRGIGNPPSPQWVDETFEVGKTYVDYAFGSCTNDYAVQMMGTLTFKAPQGATEFPYARILAAPYTAQGGEAEILLEPGAPFIISHVDKLPDGSFKVELQPKSRE